MAFDYFPLKEKTRYCYKFTSSDFQGTAKVYIDILTVAEDNNKTEAKARMTFTLRDSHTTEFLITKDPEWLITTDGVTTGGRKEFPYPVKEGSKWVESPDSCEIVSLSDKLNIEAGKFSNCMKVLTLVADGDGGKAVRYYAPDVGLVLESYHTEDKICDLELVSVTQIPESEMDTKKKRRDR